MAHVEGLAARQAALSMLDAVLRRGHTLESAAHGSRLPPADAGLALAIAGETLRRLPDLDALIDSATRQRLPDDSKARTVLRLALAQKIALGTPDHAVVATALPLVAGGPRRLVHGVLGTLLRRGAALPETATLPAAVDQRWRAAWGDDVVQAAGRAIGQRPPLDLSFASADEAAAYPLGVSLAARHRRIADAGSVTELPRFDEGIFWVQDLAASLPARLMPGEPADVLDLCAAPGGKTMQLAAAGHRVTSLDRSKGRLARLADNLARTGLEAELVVAEALEWRAPRQFDAVLLDAPCSATGTFRRHPEVLYRASSRIIAESAEFQAQLIDHAAKMVRPGGTLVYAVCSLEPQEGEAIVSDFLDRNPAFTTEPPDSHALPGGVTPSPQGWLRILPGLLEGEGGLDGFFVAGLRRI
jgi:16S rRNA (cytosine967-C5)-methyltransferase